MTNQLPEKYTPPEPAMYCPICQRAVYPKHDWWSGNNYYHHDPVPHDDDDIQALQVPIQ